MGINQNRILRLPELKAKINASRAWIYDMEKRGLFPSRIKLGARSVGWVESEIENWLQQRIEHSRASNIGGAK